MLHLDGEHRVRTFARNTAEALASLLTAAATVWRCAQATLPVQRSCCFARRGTTPLTFGPSPIRDELQVGSQVARLSSSLGCNVRDRSRTSGSHALLVSKHMSFFPGIAPGHFSRPNTETPAYRVLRGSSLLDSWSPPLPFRDSAHLGSPWLPSPLWRTARVFGCASPVHKAPTFTGKPSRALERVKLFPAGTFNPGPRAPLDTRPCTSRC